MTYATPTKAPSGRTTIESSFSRPELGEHIRITFRSGVGTQKTVVDFDRVAAREFCEALIAELNASEPF